MNESFDGQSQARRDIERMIPNMSRDLLRAKRSEKGFSFPNATVNGFPAEFHTMMISTVIASDALYSYKTEDGNIYNYITWYLESAINMIIDELNKHKIAEDFILANPLNFYKKIADTFYKNKDIKKTSELLSIPENKHYIDKSVEIYEDRIL